MFGSHCCNQNVSNYLLSEVHALFYSNAPMDDIANIFFASLTIVDTFAFRAPLNLHLYYIPLAALKNKIRYVLKFISKLAMSTITK